MPLLYETTFAPRSLSQVGDTQKTLVIIVAYPASSLVIADQITGKPVTSAIILIDSQQKTSDQSGIVALDLAAGSYTVKITHSQYLAKTVNVTLPLTAPLTVKLIPLWSIGLGIAAAVTVGIAVVAKVVWK